MDEVQGPAYRICTISCGSDRKSRKIGASVSAYKRKNKSSERQNILPKYEQSVNMPKNFPKTAVFRIFRQISAKMRLESQCLCGFPEVAVEMEEARLGR